MEHGSGVELKTNISLSDDITPQTHQEGSGASKKGYVRAALGVRDKI